MLPRLSICLSAFALAGLSACGKAPEPKPTPTVEITPSEPDVEAPVESPTIKVDFQCREIKVATEFREDDVVIDLEGTPIILPRVISGSGARYAGETDLGFGEFWNKGDDARFTVGDTDYGPCSVDKSEAEAETSAPSLTAQEWRAEDINAAGIIDMSHATLNFKADGSVSGDASCNRYTGSYTQDEDTLTFTPLATTRKACPPALMDQEQKFLAVLAQPVTMSFDSTGALILTSENGSIKAR